MIVHDAQKKSLIFIEFGGEGGMQLLKMYKGEVMASNYKKMWKKTLIWPRSVRVSTASFSFSVRSRRAHRDSLLKVFYTDYPHRKPCRDVLVQGGNAYVFSIYNIIQIIHIVYAYIAKSRHF